MFNCPERVLNIIKKISMEYHNLDGKRNVGVLKNFLEKRGFEVKTANVRNGCGMLYARGKLR